MAVVRSVQASQKLFSEGKGTVVFVSNGSRRASSILAASSNDSVPTEYLLSMGWAVLFHGKGHLSQFDARMQEQ